MKVSRWGEFAALFALFVVAGYMAPWWAVAAPAFAYGFLRLKGEGWRMYVILALVAALAWLLPALLQDGAVGWRISGRIAGVIGLHSEIFGGIFAYLLTISLAALMTILGSSAGSALREVLQPLLKRSANKPAD